jgi:O-succinylbenzoic acid--CoA ligase
MLHIDFNQDELQFLCHSDYQHLIPRIKESLSPYDLKHHFILFSSGTTGGNLKGYAISRAALFANAKAVNDHFDLKSDDIWALSLPLYHIGGLSVMARAHLLGNKVLDVRGWDPEKWVKNIASATITTIVPTQLYDLIHLKLSPSENLKKLIVGGDFLSSTLKAQAQELRWPVIRTFGMSEVCSQIASGKSPQTDELSVMPLHQVKINNKQRLLIKSPALFTLQFTMGSDFQVSLAQDLLDSEGFYPTSDRVELTGQALRHLGRFGDEYKVAGHLINLFELKERLATFLLENDLFGKMEFILENDERKGKRLILLSLPLEELKTLRNMISTLIGPVKIDEIKIVNTFKRTDLGKLKGQQ